VLYHGLEVLGGAASDPEPADPRRRAALFVIEESKLAEAVCLSALSGRGAYLLRLHGMAMSGPEFRGFHPEPFAIAYAIVAVFLFGPEAVRRADVGPPPQPSEEKAHRGGRRRE